MNTPSLDWGIGDLSFVFKNPLEKKVIKAPG
jgi:hypothetical protein